jgi:hypothetical protein
VGWHDITMGLAGVFRWPISKETTEVRTGPAHRISALTCRRGCLSPKGDFIIVAELGSVRIFDLANAGQPRQLTGHSQANTVCVKPLGSGLDMGQYLANALTRGGNEYLIRVFASEATKGQIK